MQNDNITLHVAKSNTADITDVNFTRYDEISGRSTYVSDQHTPGNRDMFSITRSLPKRAGNFKGVGKSTFKYTVDRSVNGVEWGTAIAAPIIIEVSFSIPVGCDIAAVLEARQVVVAALDDDTLMDKLNVQLMV